MKIAQRSASTALRIPATYALLLISALWTQPSVAAEGLANPDSAASVSTASQYPKDKGTFLRCADLKIRTRDFLRVHYSFDSFNELLSVRTFDTFFRALDPGKAYFLQSDIDSFEKYRKTLAREVASSRCDFIYDAFNLMDKRLENSIGLIEEILAKPFDYSVDESIEIDRSKLDWVKNEQELRERWRKTLKFMSMSMSETEDDPKKIPERLLKRYQRDLKNFRERTTDEAHALFLNAFAAALDPHSSYFKPVDQDEFRINFALELVGIGASLSQRDGYTIVEAIIPGGSAARDGRLQKGDKIIAVDPGTGEGVIDVVDMELSKVVQHIRGKKDSVVKLSILRKAPGGEAARLQLDLVRDKVKLSDGEAKSDVLTIGKKTFGVIDLPSFYMDYQGSQTGDGDFRSSARDVKREIDALQKKKVDGIILDLRSNGGGDLSECSRITGLFLDEGPIVQIQDRDRRVSSLNDQTPGAVYKGPLMLLINRQSASASEIIAGALQDYGRALIVGNERTYGKGTVQHVVDIPGRGGRQSDGALKVTISKFFLPSGRSNQEVGVASNIVIPNVLDSFDFSEAKQDYVLKNSSIRPHADFKKILDWKPIEAELLKKSTERVKANKEFEKVFKAVAEANKEREKTTLSLKKDKTKESTKSDKKNHDGDSAAAEGAESETAERKVIRDGDIELREAAAILADAISLIGQDDWTRESSAQPGKPSGQK